MAERLDDGMHITSRRLREISSDTSDGANVYFSTPANHVRRGVDSDNTRTSSHFLTTVTLAKSRAATSRYPRDDGVAWRSAVTTCCDMFA